MRRHAWVALVLAGWAPSVALAQAPAGQDLPLVLRARNCIERVPVDTAPEWCARLIREIHDPVTGASVSDRAVGYVLLAAISLRRRDIEDARSNLRVALRLDSSQTGRPFGYLHPELGALAEAERSAWASRDTTLPPIATLDHAPTLARRPRPWYARSLVRHGLTGEVVLLVVIDTLGRVEPGLLQILSRTDTVFDLAATEYAIKARFRPARALDHPVRAAARLPLRFDDPVASEAEMDQKPEVISGPAPSYPARMLDAGIQGRVVLEFVVDTFGLAERESIEIVSSPHPEFDAPAARYVMTATFRPARLDGRAVRSLVRLPINYRIR